MLLILHFCGAEKLIKEWQKELTLIRLLLKDRGLHSFLSHLFLNVQSFYKRGDIGELLEKTEQVKEPIHNCQTFSLR